MANERFLLAEEIRKDLQPLVAEINAIQVAMESRTAQFQQAVLELERMTDNLRTRTSLIEKRLTEFYEREKRRVGEELDEQFNQNKE